MSTYIKMDDITGSVTAANHVGWIEANSLDFGAERKLSTKAGSMGDRHTGDILFTELTLYKQFDKSTPHLFQAFCKRTNMSQVTIDICGSDAAQSPYVKYTLSNVVVSGYKHFIAEDNIPSEEVKLNFTKVSISYIGKDSANRSGSPITAGFNLENSQSL